LVRVKLAQGQAPAALDMLDGMPNGVGPGSGCVAAARPGIAGPEIVPQTLERALELAAGRCGADCTAAASLEILRGRASLRRGDVLPRGLTPSAAWPCCVSVTSRTNWATPGACWPLRAWRLAMSAALVAAQAALDIDRRLALPEKIARDWLLLGDIHRRFTLGQPSGGNDARRGLRQGARSRRGGRPEGNLPDRIAGFAGYRHVKKSCCPLPHSA
jgi:hypothetical protein